jgi:hypothetical protein
MKRSNIIFFGIFILVVLIITTHYIVLNAMKASRHYTKIEHNENNFWQKYSVDKADTIYIHGFSNMNITIGDSMYYSINGEKMSYMRVKQKSGRLEMYGDTLLKLYNTEIQKTGNVDLNVPEGTQLILVNTDFSLNPLLDGSSIFLKLDSSNLSEFELQYKDSNPDPRRIELIKLTMRNGSTATLSNVKINNLSAGVFDSSRLDDGNSEINYGGVQLDPNAQISISGNNIKRIKLLNEINY